MHQAGGPAWFTTQMSLPSVNYFTGAIFTVVAGEVHSLMLDSSIVLSTAVTDAERIPSIPRIKRTLCMRTSVKKRL